MQLTDLDGLVFPAALTHLSLVGADALINRAFLHRSVAESELVSLLLLSILL